jgi:hypothetical protein
METPERVVLASSAQMWRLNSIGLVELRDQPGEPLPRDAVKEVLAQALADGLWHPSSPRGKRGPVKASQ